jgi:aminoglycoside phosphotransferase (APT) family kinase protein
VLQPDDARRILDEFGLGSDGVLTGPVARGEVGQVWRLATTDAVYAVKEPFEPPDESATDDEAAFQELGTAAGVPAPRVVRTPDGRVLVRIRTAVIRVYTWVELRAPDRHLDTTAVADAVALLHRVRYTGANGLHPWYTDPIGRAEWRSLVDDLVRARAPFADRFADRFTELVALEQLISEPDDVQTCHRDLFADNVLATGTGDVCVIDWENSGLADPSQELAVVIFEFGGDDARRIRDLHDAYRARGGPGLVHRPEAFSMTITQLGHIGHVSARRWLDDPRPDERERNTRRVEEFLSDGITRDRIELMLDAIER